jgi:dienelactone hydrolase
MHQSVRPCVAAIMLLAPALHVAEAQRLAVPAEASVAESFRIRAEGLPPGALVVMRSRQQDSTGQVWQAVAEVIADQDGVVDLSLIAPQSGSYTGVVPMGLITLADVRGPSAGRMRYTAPRLDSLPILLQLELDGRVVDSATVIRTFTAPGVTETRVRERGLVGSLFRPAGAGPFPAILAIGGSEGGIGARQEAALLASSGYVALALAYFGLDSLPAQLDRIPLEYFMTGLDYLGRQPGVDSARLGIVGTSKGAEAALAVATRSRRFRAVVAYAPSHVVWSCICQPPDHSSWTFEGRALPAVPPGVDPTYQRAAGEPLRPAVNYGYRLRDSAAAVQAAIPVERIRGPVLLIAGEEDQLWPSAMMARALADRVRRNGGQVELLIYPGAGHLIGKAYLPAGSTLIAGGRLESGGTSAANAAAQADSWAVVLRILAGALGRGPSR